MNEVEKKPLIIVALVILIGLILLFMYSVTFGNSFGGAFYDSSSSADAWLDTNRNGLKDPGESPLEGVCILSFVSDYSDPSLCTDNRFLTNPAGVWNGGEFFAGASCNGVYIFAYPPPGYQATTRVKVRNCYASFGFAPLLPTPAH